MFSSFQPWFITLYIAFHSPCTADAVSNLEKECDLVFCPWFAQRIGPLSPIWPSLVIYGADAHQQNWQEIRQTEWLMTLIGQITVYHSDYVGMEVENVQDLNGKIISLGTQSNVQENDWYLYNIGSVTSLQYDRASTGHHLYANHPTLKNTSPL